MTVAGTTVDAGGGGVTIRLGGGGVTIRLGGGGPTGLEGTVEVVDGAWTVSEVGASSNRASTSVSFSCTYSAARFNVTFGRASAAVGGGAVVAAPGDAGAALDDAPEVVGGEGGLVGAAAAAGVVLEVTGTTSFGMFARHGFVAAAGTATFVVLVPIASWRPRATATAAPSAQAPTAAT